MPKNTATPPILQIRMSTFRWKDAQKKVVKTLFDFNLGQHIKTHAITILIFNMIRQKSLHGTVHFPNSVGKILPFFVLTSTRLFYIRSKIFLHIQIKWILLFQMIYCSSFIVHFFIVKLSVYEKSLHLTELGSSSLILSISKKISLMLTHIGNYIGKNNFRKKSMFCYFSREMEGRCLRHVCRVDQALS